MRNLTKAAASAMALMIYTATLPVSANEPAKPDAAAAAPAPAAAAPAGEQKPTAAAAAPAAGDPVLPGDTVKATEKGKLKNPYTDKPEAIEEGKKLYLSYSCNGCHGGGGGGGMCPPLTNETFIYGSDDDTLFRLITLGSKELQTHGYARLKQEAVKGPMPPYINIIKDTDKLWKVIAFIRSVYGGRPETRNW